LVWIAAVIDAIVAAAMTHPRGAEIDVIVFVGVGAPAPRREDGERTGPGEIIVHCHLLVFIFY